jgi:hypothetical protein
VSLALLLITLGVLAVSPDVSAQTSGKTSALVDLRAAASELPQLRSLLVSWRGELIAEHYARGVRPGALANVKSASKSVVAALVGIAIERR